MRMAGGAYLGDTISLIAVRSSPSICTSANAGTHTRSSPLGATYPRAMAIAFTAWLIAAAPMAWSSAVPFSRTTPASAPATAVGFDLAATLRMFMGACLLGGVGGNSPPPWRGLFLSWAFWRILPLRSRPRPLQGGRLGGRLGMHVDDEHGRLLPEALHQLPANAEGRVEGLHEDPAFQVDHPHPRAAPRTRGTEDARPPSGGARRVVRGPQQTQIAVEQGGDLPGLPGVVAPGHHVDAGGHDLLERLAGD